MNELERTALNEILRTVTYIAEKLDEVDSKISSNDSQVLEHQKKIEFHFHVVNNSMQVVL